MRRFLSQLVPFIFFGIAIVAFVFGIMLLAYLFFFGALVGIILFLISWLRERFFPSKTLTRPSPRQGRTFDSDDWKKK